MEGAVTSKKKASLMKSTAHYNVWIQEGVSLGSFSLDDYARELENKIYPVLLANTGKHNDLNSDGKADILISNSIDNRTGGFVGGYVSSGDYFNIQHSNQRDILYMNSRNLSRKTNFYSTTSHELQHLHRIKYELDPTVGFKSDSTWINEGTSEYISDESGHGPQNSRLRCYYNSCSLNGRSVFDQKADLPSYAFRYMFLSYVFHSVATTKAQREEFVYKVTSGFTDKEQRNAASHRANNADNLFKAFHAYAPKHTASVSTLGSTSSDIFSKLYGSFLLQTTNGFSAANRGRKDTGTRNIDFTNIIARYPVPDFLTKVNNSSVKFSNVAASVPSSNQSGVFHVYSGTSSGTNNYIDFQNTTGGSTVTLRYNYTMTASGDINPAISSNLSYFPLDTSHINQSYQENTPICIHGRLSQEFQFKVNRNPHLYQLVSK